MYCVEDKSLKNMLSLPDMFAHSFLAGILPSCKNMVVVLPGTALFTRPTFTAATGRQTPRNVKCAGGGATAETSSVFGIAETA